MFLQKPEWSRFVMNLRLVWEESKFKREWIKDLNEFDKIKNPLSLLKDSSMVEPLGNCGKKVMMWWLRAEARADSKFPSGLVFLVLPQVTIQDFFLVILLLRFVSDFDAGG